VIKVVRKKGLPKVGELVLCKVERVSQFAGWCVLEEYPDIRGMIHISEAVGKWISDIREYVKMNKQYVAKVIRVDPEKKFVTLSLRRVSDFEAKEKLNAFRKEKKAEKILEKAAEKLGKNLDQAYQEIGYALQEQFESLSAAMDAIKNSKSSLLQSFPEQWIEALSEIIQKTFKEKEIVLKAEIEIKSYAPDGVEKIKNALLKLENLGLTVKYISAPKYRVEIKTKNPKVEEKKLKEILESVVKDFGGNYRMIK